MAKLVRAIIREDMTMPVVTALEQAGVTGTTVLSAKGRGGHASMASYRGVPYRVLLPMTIVEVLTSDDTANDVARIVLEHAHTGEHGDGHVMIVDVDQWYSVRTKFRGD